MARGTGALYIFPFYFHIGENPLQLSPGCHLIVSRLPNNFLISGTAPGWLETPGEVRLFSLYQARKNNKKKKTRRAHFTCFLFFFFYT